MDIHTPHRPHRRLPTPRRSPRRTQKTNRRPRRKNRQTHQKPRRTPITQRPRNRIHPFVRPLARRILRNHRRRIPHTPPQTTPPRRTTRPHPPTLTKQETKKPRQTTGALPYQTDHVIVAETHEPCANLTVLNGLTDKPVASTWKPVDSAPAARTYNSLKFGRIKSENVRI